MKKLMIFDGDVVMSEKFTLLKVNILKLFL